MNAQEVYIADITSPVMLDKISTIHAESIYRGPVTKEMANAVRDTLLGLGLTRQTSVLLCSIENWLKKDWPGGKK